jgi:hypothetical protein
LAEQVADGLDQRLEHARILHLRQAMGGVRADEPSARPRIGWFSA